MLLSLLLEEHLTWNVPLLIILVCIICFYGYVCKRSRMGNFFSLHTSLFLIGVSLLYIMIGSPLTAISHLSFSFHMIQMSLLYFIIPPLLLLGIPEWMFMHISKHLNLRKYRFIQFISPKIALYTFSVLFLMYHLPITLQFLSKYAALQTSYTSILFILSFYMWWPIVAPNTKQPLHADHKKRYAFISGLLITPACILFILTALLDGANNPFIEQLTVHLCIPAESSTFNILPPPFNTKYDQLMAGISMMGLHKFGLVIAFKLEYKVFQHKHQIATQSTNLFYSTKRSIS